MGDLARLRDQSEADDPSTQLVPSSQTPEPTSNMYCLSSAHDPRMLTENRFFYWDQNDPNCPVCPVCQRQVQAQFCGINAKGQPTIPANLLALSERIGERV